MYASDVGPTRRVEGEANGLWLMSEHEAQELAGGDQLTGHVSQAAYFHIGPWP